MKNTLLLGFIISLFLISSCEFEKEAKPNIVLIIIDTLSAKHLSCYGYARNTSPTIDSLAQTGILFENCQAQAPWTLPGMASIFTGLSEKSHGCSNYNGFSHGLDPEIPTITTILKENGYSTAAAVNIGYLGEVFGITRGFDFFNINEDGLDNAAITVDIVLNHLKTIDSDKPFFLTMHLFDPHLPYDSPAPFNTMYSRSRPDGSFEWPKITECSDPLLIEFMTAKYDSEINWTDSQLSRFFAGMHELELTENTIFILTADHGEEFMQHGDWGHAHNLYQQALHIPLIITGPGINEGARISENVGQFDILPTILTLLGIDSLGQIEGINLLSDFPADRVIPSSGTLGAEIHSATCIQGNKKVLWFIEPDSSETYNLRLDPGEMNQLETDGLLLQSVMEYWAWPCICFPTSNEESQIEQKRLQDLGYIN